MKKNLSLFVLIFLVFLNFSKTYSQKVELSYKIHSAKYILDGKVYEIMGEVTNNSGKNVRGVMMNLNYFDASGKKPTGSNYLEESQKENYSDKQSTTTDYLAAGVTVPFRFVRFADKMSGKVARSEAVFTAKKIKATTCAVIENVKTELMNQGYGVNYQKVTGQIKCTAGMVFSAGVIIAGYDENGKILQISDFVIDGAEKLTTGQSKSFECKFWENGLKFAKVKVFPSYRGDWNEE